MTTKLDIVKHHDEVEQMSPVTKLHTLTFSFTTSFVVFLWSYISDFYISNRLLGFIFSFILSASFYKGIYNVIAHICNKIDFVKKWALGRYYFDGLWIGICKVNDDIEYFFEIYEQTVEDLIIKGTEFDSNDNLIGTWIISHPYINILESKFSYYYELSDIENLDITLGYSQGIIHWGKYHLADKVVGFAVDNYSNRKQPYMSVKVNQKEYKNDLYGWIRSNFMSEVHKLDIDKS